MTTPEILHLIPLLVWVVALACRVGGVGPRRGRFAPQPRRQRPPRRHVPRQQRAAGGPASAFDTTVLREA